MAAPNPWTSDDEGDTRPLALTRGHLHRVLPLPPVPPPVLPAVARAAAPVQAPPAPAPVSVPAAGPAVRPDGLRLWRSSTLTATLCWVGCHGGAGESTLADLTPGTLATDHRWPSPPTDRPPARVVLVARTHLAGLAAAQRALGQWATGQAGNVDLLALLLLADAPGKLPKELQPTLELLQAGLMGHPLRRIGWVPDWRLGRLEVPRDLFGVLGEITRLASAAG